MIHVSFDIAIIMIRYVQQFRSALIQSLKVLGLLFFLVRYLFCVLVLGTWCGVVDIGGEVADLCVRVKDGAGGALLEDGLTAGALDELFAVLGVCVGTIRFAVTET